MADTFDRFREHMEGYSVAEAESAEFDEYRKEIKELQRRNEIRERQTGVDPKLVNEDDPKFKAAKAAKKRHEFYVKDTAGYLRGNLDTILSESETSGLVQALRFVPAKSDTHKELAELIGDYQMYQDLTKPMGKDEADAKKRQEDATEKFQKRLPKIIQRIMMDKGVEEERAKIEAEYLALTATREYLQGVIEDESKATAKRLEETGRREIATYLMSTLKKDEDYVAFGKMLYALHPKKEE